MRNVLKKIGFIMIAVLWFGAYYALNMGVPMAAIMFAEPGTMFDEMLGAVEKVMLYFNNGTFDLATFPIETLKMASLGALLPMLLGSAACLPLFLIMLKNKGGRYGRVDAGKASKWICLFMIGDIIATFVTGLLNNVPALQENNAFLNAASVLYTNGNLGLAILEVGILAPVVEEFIFRRGLQRNLQKVNPVFGLIAASLAFGVMHGNLIQASYAFILGLMLGYVYLKTDNLAYTTLMHIACNTCAVLSGLGVLGTSIAGIPLVLFLAVAVSGAVWYMSSKKIAAPSVLARN